MIYVTPPEGGGGNLFVYSVLVLNLTTTLCEGRNVNLAFFVNFYLYSFIEIKDEYKMKPISNKPSLKSIRKKLRNNSTPAEAVLWKCLQKSQLNGYKFRRQHSIGNYILDFYCSSKQLAIELDGAAHFTDEGSESDKTRNKYLAEQNIAVLRFENKHVFENQDRLLEFILEELNRL